MSDQKAAAAPGGRWVAVFDAGKSFAKLTLFSPCGKVVNHRRRVATANGESLDCEGIEDWLITTLVDFASNYPIDVIVSIGHGAAAAIIDRRRLLCPVQDYEATIDPAIARSYQGERDGFAVNGSLLLPAGLNLGMQLHALEHRRGEVLPSTATIVPWPQYWTWRLTGVLRSEVTSLGCHTDLWSPQDAKFSPLCERRGWSRLFAPLAHAADFAGPLREDLTALLNLPEAPTVLVGLHDSNAALLAARSLGGDDIVTISTGTWFVAMGPSGDRHLPTNRDCLMNVDVAMRAVPSARWMGGREIAGLLQDHPISGGVYSGRLIQELLASEPMIRPDPGPGGQSQWCGTPCSPALREAAVMIHAGLMVDAMLDLTGTGQAVLIEGRFAEFSLPWAILAALRPQVPIYALPSEADAAFGAFTLAQPGVSGLQLASPIAPIAGPLETFKTRWRAMAAAPW